MTVPTKMGDLSATIASNSPAGTDTIGTSLDDYIRAAYGIMKQGSSRGSDIASVATLTIPDAGSYFVVTGTTTITGINDSWTGRMVVLKFSGALQLTHGSGFILPGGANITTVAGDVGIFVNESTGVWRCVAWTSGTFAGLTVDDVDDTPVNGATTAPVSSNWAYDHENATAAHGTTGDVVGTTDTQTLTNKTITAAGNTLTIASTDLSDTADLTYNADADVSGNSWVDSDVSNNLSTKVPTEAAVKSYVDANGGGNISAQMFYTSGTDSFTVPSGVTKLKVTVVGGGGGGGDATRNNGGTGGLAIGIVTVTPAEVVTVTIGAGGSGANSTYGSPGGDSSFGAYVSATGGSGGTTATPTNGIGSVDAAQQSIRTNIATTSPLFGSSSTRARNGTTNRPGIDFDPTDVYIPGSNGLKESGSTASDASGGVGGMVLVEWVG